MARRARRELARKLDWHDEYDGPPTDLPYEYSFVKLYCFSRQQLEVPRVRAQYAAVVLWMDLSGSEEGKQHDNARSRFSGFAQAYFEETDAKRLYVVDFTKLKNEFLAETATHRLSKVTKKILKVLTKFNPYASTLIAVGPAACIAVKLVCQSDLMDERFDRVVLVRPKLPQSGVWFRYERQEKLRTALAICAETEERIDFVASQDFVLQACDAGRVHRVRLEEGDDEKDSALVSWLGAQDGYFDCEETATVYPPQEYDVYDEIYMNEIIFIMDKYSKQFTQKFFNYGDGEEYEYSDEEEESGEEEEEEENGEEDGEQGG